MTNITLIHVGDFKEKYFKDAENEYIKRIKAFCDYKTVCIKEESAFGEDSEKLIKRALEKEAAGIRAAIPKQAVKVALCIEGKQMSSEDFAAHIENVTQTASNICFIIGSSHGLSDKVKRAADYKLSLSKMTFPHQLFRVMLLESVYRAFNIIKGTKYHK